MSLSGTIISDSTWVDLTSLYPLELVNKPEIGANQIIVKFKKGDSVTKQLNFFIFYIPYGDFPNSDKVEFSKIWKFKNDSKLEEGGDIDIDKSNLLRLGFEHNDDIKKGEGGCLSATIKSSIVSLENIILPPEDQSYHVRVVGDVYTQDHNPNNDGTYDAFEIAINGKVAKRYSNPKTPIDCTGDNGKPFEHEEPINAKIPLSSYSNEMTLSLENHLRFDKFFNTYTKIDTVYIDY